MITMTTYKCPFCCKTWTLDPPLVYDSHTAARKLATHTTHWPYATERKVGGSHVRIQLREGRRIISDARHLCPALSF